MCTSAALRLLLLTGLLVACGRPAGASYNEPRVVGAPVATTLTSAQQSGTAFQPRAAGSAFVVLSSVLTGTLNVGTTLVVTMAPTSAGTYVGTGCTYQVATSLLSASYGTCGLVVPPGYWLKITAGTTSVLANTTTTMYVSSF